MTITMDKKTLGKLILTIAVVVILGQVWRMCGDFNTRSITFSILGGILGIGLWVVGSDEEDDRHKQEARAKHYCHYCGREGKK